MAKLRSAFTQMFPPAPKFSTDDVQDLSDRVAIVTGSNGGVGYQTAKVLLEHNAKVYLACRNPEYAQAAIEKLESETGGKKALFLKLDLANLKSVKESAATFSEYVGLLDNISMLLTARPDRNHNSIS